MGTKWHVEKEGNGWIVVDATGTAEPDAVTHTRKSDAQKEAEKLNADADAWNRKGLADAPHTDNF